MGNNRSTAGRHHKAEQSFRREMKADPPSGTRQHDMKWLRHNKGNRTTQAQRVGRKEGTEGQGAQEERARGNRTEQEPERAEGKGGKGELTPLVP